MSYETKIRIEVTSDVHRHLRELKQRGESFNETLRRVFELPKGKPVSTSVIESLENFDKEEVCSS